MAESRARRPSHPVAERRSATAGPRQTASTAAGPRSAKPAALRAAKRAAPTAAPARGTPHRPIRPGARRERADASIGDWLRGIRFSGFTLVMLLIMVVAVLVLAPTVSTLVAQNRQAADLAARVDSERASVRDMRADRARWNDPSYIRAQARDRLLYVMPGETSFLVIDDRSPSATASASESADRGIHRTETNWLGSLVGSAFTAGLTDQPAADLTTDPATGQ